MAGHMRANISKEGGITITPRIIGGALKPWEDESSMSVIKVDSSGSVFITGSLSANINAGDIQIGAVEIKNSTTDDRVTVDTSGYLYVKSSGSKSSEISSSVAQLLPSENTNYAYSFYNSTALESGSVVKASSGVLYSISGYNYGSDQFIQIHNSGSSLENTEQPVTVLKAAADNNFSFDGARFGIPFSNGIVITNSSTADTLTTGSNNCWFNVTYK